VKGSWVSIGEQEGEGDPDSSHSFFNNLGLKLRTAYSAFLVCYRTDCLMGIGANAITVISTLLKNMAPMKKEIKVEESAAPKEAATRVKRGGYRGKYKNILVVPTTM
jgi:hypothetical protein